jgi:CDP-glycerol glycerophosphotransferase (TagB/SpsB family)
MFRKNNFEKFPNLKEIGYPKIDYLQKKYSEKLKMKKNSIVIAPTLFEGFPEFTILDYLKDIIYELLNSTSYSIILRPHPGNRNHTEVLELIKHFNNNTRFQYDSAENYIDTYAKSQILITDISGTAYTFAFLTLCPVIFFLPNNDAIKKNNYDKLNFFLNSTKIGSVVHNVKLISQEINKVQLKIKQYNESIQTLSKDIKYYGKAKKKFKEELDLIN